MSNLTCMVVLTDGKARPGGRGGGDEAMSAVTGEGPAPAGSSPSTLHWAGGGGWG